MIEIGRLLIVRDRSIDETGRKRGIIVGSGIVFRDEKFYEVIEYTENLPFMIHAITRETNYDEFGKGKNVLEHWHREIEVVYTMGGNARHYIDGAVHVSEAGSLFVVNSESIHKVISDNRVFEYLDQAAVVLNLNYEFVKQLVPEMDLMYFVPEVIKGVKEAALLMQELSQYADKRRGLEAYEDLRVMGLVYQLLSCLCRNALVMKEEVLPVRNQKNLERLRGVMQYVAEHYKEPITQREVAEGFYFTKEYFSRFFKKNTGLTFIEYLTRYRVNAARVELIGGKGTILEIALKHGFSDSRGLIHAFKEVYGITPLQYRKNVQYRGTVFDHEEE